MIGRVLVGYDGSQSSERALAFAIDFAGRYAAQLHVVAVVRPPEFGDDVETEAVIEQAQRHVSRKLAAARARVEAAGLQGVFETAVGHPSEQIVRYAERNGVDHIVVGHRGHTLFERWLIGSVARQVIAYAHCAVTVVRD